MDHAARRRGLVERLSELEIDGLLVTRLMNVRYLTGFSGSNGQLLLWGDDGVFFTDSRYDEQTRREVQGLDRKLYSRDFHRAVAEAARGARIRRIGFEAAGVTYRIWQQLAAAVEGEVVPIGEEVDRLRWGKDPEEIALLERAQAATDDAFERLVAKLAEGLTEREAAFELEQAMRQAGGERVGFDTIVAFGENAAEPHHRPTDRPLASGDVVKLDFGCVVDGYHSDMTRTVAFGEPDQRMREVYDVVLRAHLAGTERVRAGISGAEADAAARDVIERAGFGDRFGHSLGHGVGLEIHEGPGLRKESDDVLPGGAVVTVEPGIYLPGVGGVRIEDMVVVDADGCRPLPRTPKDLLVV